MKPTFPHLLGLLVFIATAAVFSDTNMLLGGEGKASDINIAVVATPSTFYVSGDTTPAALNNGFDPRSSQDRSKRSYGNWPRRGTQWVQYEWDRPIAINRIDIYWWNDRRGVRTPKACRLLYWKNGTFLPVENVEGLGVAESTYNTTTFDEVRTTKLRLESDSTERYSTGILEWKVYDSGNSPDFPPVVEAGIDRVVILGGKTYLTGSVKTLKQTAGPSGINNLIDAANKLAGKPHSRHRGYVFSNAWVLNTVESICMALLVDPRGDKEIIKAQNKIRQTLEKWIPLIRQYEAVGHAVRASYSYAPQQNPVDRLDQRPIAHW